MKVSELMDDIRSLDLVLPEFQREYVWTLEQSKQLLVSLFRGFPTGSLLFWKTSNPPEVKNVEIDPEKLGATEVILDGQQRLTTLYLLTQNEIPPYYNSDDIRYDPRDLYFDLDTGDFQYYQVTKMQHNPAWRAVTECFTNKNIPLFEIAQAKAAEDREAFSLAQRYNDNLTQLRLILDRTYPIQIVPPTASIDDAIEVFDRVNRLGTQLTEAELALAHITGKWPEARQKMKERIAVLKLKHFEFDLTFMVRALTAVVRGRALFETIHETPAAPLMEGWDKLTRILDYLVAVLIGQANIHSTEDLNTNNVLIPAIAYLAVYSSFDSDETMRHFIHWNYAASTWARYTSQTNQRLDHDISLIQRDRKPWRELVDAIIDQRGRIQVKPSDLEGRTTRHPLYRMTFVMAKTQGAIDWFNGLPLDVIGDGSYSIHSHHIFPTSLLYSKRGGYDSDNHLHRKIVNEIANRAFLSGPSNVGLGNTPPAEYLPKVVSQYPGALEKQFVPTDPALWKLERYEDFLAVRRRLIAQAINEKMEELLVGIEPPEPEELKALLVGEGPAVEYKSSIRWDMRRNQVNKDLEKVIAKTVAGFLNTEGGTLLIGVADDTTVLGIQYDLQTLGRQDLDGYEQKLHQVLTNYLGAEYSQYEHVSFEPSNGNTVCVVRVDPSPEPVYLEDKDQKEFYIRVGNTTRPLDMQAAHDYISMHWPT
jgi:hypothetical protein